MPSLSEETNGRVERLMPGATIGIIGGMLKENSLSNVES